MMPRVSKTLLQAGLVWAMTAASAMACSAPQGAAQAIAELHQWMNSERKARGMAPFAASSALDQAARRQGCDMVQHNYFAHSRPGGPSLKQRIKETGYPLRGGNENLAYTRQVRAMTTAEIWRNSPKHWEAIINPSNRDVGLSVVAGNGKVYWVMVAAR